MRINQSQSKPPPATPMTKLVSRPEREAKSLKLTLYGMWYLTHHTDQVEGMSSKRYSGSKTLFTKPCMSFQQKETYIWDFSVFEWRILHDALIALWSGLSGRHDEPRSRQTSEGDDEEESAVANHSFVKFYLGLSVCHEVKMGFWSHGLELFKSPSKLTYISRLQIPSAWKERECEEHTLYRILSWWNIGTISKTVT